MFSRKHGPLYDGVPRASWLVHSSLFDEKMSSDKDFLVKLAPLLERAIVIWPAATALTQGLEWCSSTAQGELQAQCLRSTAKLMSSFASGGTEARTVLVGIEIAIGQCADIPKTAFPADVFEVWANFVSHSVGLLQGPRFGDVALLEVCMSVAPFIGLDVVTYSGGILGSLQVGPSSRMPWKF